MFDNTPRLVAYASFSFVFLALVIFTDFNKDIIVFISFFIAVAALLIFIFRTKGLEKLKMALIVFAYISIPTFALMFSGVLNGIPGPWNGILLALIVGISAIAAIFTVVKLGLVGVVDVDGDLYFR